ncbi:hypothetical protein T310_10089, partial [Rasamsonia emersonii CBS 393.64]
IRSGVVPRPGLSTRAKPTQHHLVLVLGGLGTGTIARSELVAAKHFSPIVIHQLDSSVNLDVAFIISSNQCICLRPFFENDSSLAICPRHFCVS